jgi:hypothetical protein
LPVGGKSQVALQRTGGFAEFSCMASSQTLEPSVLMLDDGELTSIHRILQRLGADVERLQGRRIGDSVWRPRDLLVTSLQRTLEMPRLEPSASEGPGPIWICVHNQDFPVLRERLRKLGVHYLVHSALDRESLRLFLLQLLHTGPERRTRFRLSLQAEVSVIVDGNPKPARLVELSEHACRLLTTSDLGSAGVAQIVLSESIIGSQAVELTGPVIRTTQCESRSGARLHSTVVSLTNLEPETRAVIDRILTGQEMGTRVSPLAGETDAGDPEEGGDAEPEGSERRRHERHAYLGRVELLELCEANDEDAAIGHDLSLTGIRVAGYPDLDPGTELTLALYGGSREEPVVVQATVVREAGPEEVALRFGVLSDRQRRGLEKLTVGLPSLASLKNDRSIVMTKIVER